MGLANTYSRRLRASQPDSVDVYQYDEVPDKVRVQIVSIVRDLLESKMESKDLSAWTWRGK